MESIINKKGMIIQILLYLVITSLGFSCSKEKQEVIENIWEVESIKEHADSTIKNAPNIYTLSFKNKKQYQLKLDVNSCSGDVSFKSNNKINFNAMGCTYVCCDSDFAEKLIGLIEKMNHYKTTQTILLIEGENGIFIRLKKQ